MIQPDDIIQWVRLGEIEKEKSLERRMTLSTLMREFRQLDKTQDNSKALAKLMRAFQMEVDFLTKRSETSEQALQQLQMAIPQLFPPPSSSSSQNDPPNHDPPSISAPHHDAIDALQKELHDRQSRLDELSRIESNQQREIQTLEDGNNQLQQQNNQLQQQNNQLQQETHKMQQEINTLEHHAAQTLEAAQQKSQQEASQLQQRLTEAEQRLNSLSQQSGKDDSMLQQSHAELDSVKNALVISQKETKDLQERCARQQQETTDLQECCTRQQHETKDLQERCTRQQQELVASQKETKDIQERCTRQQQELVASQKETKELQERCTRQQQELVALEEENVQLQKQQELRFELQAKLGYRDSQIAELEKKLLQQVSEKDKATQGLSANFELQIVQLKSKLTGAQEDHANLSKKLKDREDHWKKVYEEELKTSRKLVPERDQAKVALRNAEGQIEKLQVTIRELQAELDAFKGNVANDQGCISVLQQELHDVKSENLVLQKHLESASIANNQTRQELEQTSKIYEEQLASLRERFSAAEEMLEQSRLHFAGEFKKATEREASVRDGMEQTHIQMADLQVQLNDRLKEYTTLQTQYNQDIEKIKLDAETDRQKLYHLLQTTQTSLASERKQIKEFAQQVHQLQKERKELDFAAEASQLRILTLEATIAQLESSLEQLLLQRSHVSSSSSSSLTSSSSSTTTTSSSSSTSSVALLSSQTNMLNPSSAFSHASKEIFLEENHDSPDKPKSMQMDDDLIRPGGCLTPWSSQPALPPRNPIARSTPNLRSSHSSQPPTWSWVGELWPFSKPK